MIRLLAPGLTVGLFLFWSALGYGVLGVLKTGFERGREILIAPVVGAGICVLAILWPNWWGVSVRSFAWPLAAVLMLLAAATLWFRRRDVPRGDIAAAAWPLAAAFLLTGWPLVSLGFDWLSYSNDDMASYCLMAARLRDHGLVEPPSAAVVRAGADLAASWALFEFSFGRPGSHLLLAWIASLVPRSVAEVYMPVTIAAYLALVAAGGALVWRDALHRRAAFATCWLIAASALTALGTVTQLLPQVLGLALGCGFLAAVWDLHRPPFGAGRVVLAALIGASLLIVYPEFAPFVAIPLFVRLLAVGLRQRDRSRALWAAGAVVIVGVVLAAPYVDRLLPYLIRQSRQGFGSTSGFELFPYFRLSTTFANLWGLLPIARRTTEPLLSLAILAGAFLFGATCVLIWRPLRAGEPAAAVLLFMVLFGLLLFARGNGFGLFKLAMYAQPFMLGTAALVFVATPGVPRPRPHGSILVLIALLGLPAQLFYVRSSVNPAFARTEIQDQSTAMTDFRHLRDFHGRSMDVDMPVTSTAKLAGLFLHDVPLRFIGLRETFRPTADVTVVPKRLREDSSALSAIVAAMGGAAREFALRDPAQPSKSNGFHLVERPASATGSAACEAVLASTAVQSIVNRTTTGARRGIYQVLPCAEITNHLAFVSSTLGRNYYFGGADPVGLFALEADYFFPGRTFAGVGRHLLFEVLQPTPTSRLLVDFTSSLKSDGANLLPPVGVVGAERLAIGAVGRGSARLYSKPLRPQWIDGHAYVAVDFGIDGTRYPDTRRGLMRWLGRDLEVDPRRLVGLARNISLVSDAEYERLTPPAQIARFPNDLDSPALEYSGLYEDGWVADNLVVVLSRPTGAGTLALKGTLLPTSSGSGMTITIDVDGTPAVSQRRDPGPFAIDVAVPAGKAGRIVVGVRFSAVRPLSALDRRPASAHLEFLGVIPASN